MVRRSKFHALTFFTSFNVFQRFFSRLRVPLHSAGASESLPPNYFQTACKVRKLVSAKGRALVVGCRDEDAVGNSLVLIPCTSVPT
jgi:hypothetical protein